MLYRSVGNSGLRVSELSFGNWTARGSQASEGSARSCVLAALDAGINSFDTADVYSETRAEELLGKALAGQRREALVLATKVWYPTGPGPNDRGLSRKHVIEGCHGSLRRLGTDYVDIYYAHRYDATVPLEETMVAFADLVRTGKVLYLGVSEWTAEQIARAAELARELRVPLIANQSQYSMLWRVAEPAVSPACRRAGIGQIAWSPLAQGVLTGKYQPGGRPPEGARIAGPASGGAMDRFARRWMRTEVLSAIQRIRFLAAEAGLTMSQLALAWVLSRDTVSSAVIGASRPEQVIGNASAPGVRLEAELLESVEEILGPYVERDPTKTG